MTIEEAHQTLEKTNHLNGEYLAMYVLLQESFQQILELRSSLAETTAILDSLQNHYVPAPKEK